MFYIWVCLYLVKTSFVNQESKEILNMDKSESVKKISKLVIDFDNLKNHFGFVDYILENLNEENDKMYFVEIWNKILELKNWNYSDISVGFEKALNILKTEFNIDEKAAKIIANKEAYEWK